MTTCFLTWNRPIASDGTGLGTLYSNSYFGVFFHEPAFTAAVAFDSLCLACETIATNAFFLIFRTESHKSTGDTPLGGAKDIYPRSIVYLPAGREIQAISLFRK